MARIQEKYAVKYLAFFVYIYCLSISSLGFANDSEEGCYESALQWITPLDGRNKDVLERHALLRCQFAVQWLARYDGQSAPAREKFCKDFVLLWTHKECNYFRDDINHFAYEPCEIWSREMFGQCLDFNDAWFEH